MNEDKILNLLGLAQRAGKVISGDFIVEKAIKRKEPKLVLLAGDCAANNEKKYTQLAETHHIPLHSQMCLEDKRSYADVIIDNNGTPLNLREQLDNIWDERIESVL